MTGNFQDFIGKSKYVIALLIILSAALIVGFNLPAEDQYYRGADEGNYYRQGKLLADNGFAGFKMITDAYISTPALQDAPNPFRIGANTTTGIALSLQDSFRSISVVSLLSFMIFLAGTFFFVNRYWGAVIAIFTLLLLAFSPLEMAMARRALLDMPAMTALAFTCYAFWLWAGSGKRKYAWAFVGLMTWSVLMKEVNVIFMLFFAVFMLYLKLKGQLKSSLVQALIILSLPAAVTVGIYLAILGYKDGMALLDTMYHAVSHSAYSAMYGQGPWYRILIDYLMLSPYTMILAIGYTWHYLLYGKRNNHTDFILFLSLFMMISFSLLPKNVRYAIFFDVPLRLLAANGLLVLVSRSGIQRLVWLPAVIVVFLVSVDVYSFYNYFIDHNIYDPVSYNLLRVNRMIPDLQP